MVNRCRQYCLAHSHNAGGVPILALSSGVYGQTIELHSLRNQDFGRTFAPSLEFPHNFTPEIGLGDEFLGSIDEKVSFTMHELA